MPYFYEHTNGSIIEKPFIVVDRGGGPYEYFDSPFVRCWWFESDALRPCCTAAPPQPFETIRKQLEQSLKIAND